MYTDHQKCTVCLNVCEQHILPCKAQVCAACAYQWARQEAQSAAVARQVRAQDNSLTASEVHFQCADDTCTVRTHPFSALLSPSAPLGAHQKDEIAQALLAKVLAVRTDTVQCPHCAYTAFVDGNATHCSLARTPIQCERCGSVYKAHAQEAVVERILTQLRCAFATKTCPRCDTPTQKRGGCHHVSCAHCAFEYCWHCGQNYGAHLDKVCLSNYVTKVLFYFALVFCVLYQLRSHTLIVCLIGNCLFFTKRFLLYNVFQVLGILWFISFFDFVNAKRTAQNLKKGITFERIVRRRAVTLNTISTILGVLYLCAINYAGYAMNEFAIFIACEDAAAAFALFAYRAYSTARANWIEFVQ